MMTLNAILNKFAEVAIGHPQLETFGWGDLSFVNKFPDEGKKFGHFWVEPVGSQLIFGSNNSRIQRRFILFVFDLIRDDDKNYLSNLNSNELILIDICKMIENSNLRIVNEPILSPIYGAYFDEMTGWSCELLLESHETVGTCDVPPFYTVEANNKSLFKEGNFWIRLEDWR